MVGECCGWGCSRLISISKIPGGNPTALAEPEVWAIEYSICEDCKRYLCDRCAAKRSGRFRAARCPWCSGKLADGKRHWEKVRALPYPEAVTSYNKGVKLVQGGQFTAALHALDDAIRLRRDYPSAHFYRAVALRELGRGSEAVAALDESLRADRHNAQAAFEKGIILRALGRRPEAVAAYRQAIAIEPRYASARVNMAVTLNENGQTDEALRACDEAIRLAETGKQVDTSDAVLPHAWGAKGACLLNLRRDEEALNALDAAIDNGLEDSVTYRNRAIALERLGRRQEAALARRLSEDAARRA